MNVVRHFRPLGWATVIVLYFVQHALAVHTDVELLPQQSDHLVQGEYVGPVAGYGCSDNYCGLQVVALGNGEFLGVLYRGGLPGAGWDRQMKWKLNGSLTHAAQRAVSNDRESLVLEDERVRITVPTTGASKAAVYNSNGRQIGLMHKTYRVSPTMSARPPYHAVVLFGHGHLQKLDNATVNDENLLNVGATTKDPVGAFYMHMEFRTPFEPDKRGQGRGNSGVYIQRRYELQILDSFGLDGVANECGGLYKQRPPDVNMCLPPLTWQTYDVKFVPARWDSNRRKLANARITVQHNGVVIHNDVRLTSKTGNGRPEGPEALPILFQNHRNPVHFRNIWLINQTIPPYPPTQIVSAQPTFGAYLGTCCDQAVRRYSKCLPPILRRCR